MKFCKYCQCSKPVSAFTVRRLSPDGLSYKCRECASAYQKARYAEVPSYKDAAKERATIWAQENKEKRRDIARRWDEENIERKRALARVSASRRYAADLDKARLISRISMQKIKAASKKHNSFIHIGFAKRILAKARGICTYCARPVKLTLDHFHPVSKGGNGQASNIIPCCASCNSRKRTQDGPKWIEKEFGLDAFAAIYWRIQSLASARLP